MSDLLALTQLISAGVDLRDVEQVAQDWAVDQPENLAALMRFATEQRELTPEGFAAMLSDASFDLLNPSASAGARVAIAFTQQARYGNPQQAPAAEVPSWRDVGFTTETHDGSPWPSMDLAAPLTTPFAAMSERYDVVVIGSGCGSLAAQVFAEGGARVLLVEAGGWLGRDQIRPDALRNQRLATGLEPPAGPPVLDNPRVAADGSIVAPTDGRWSNNAFTVGGGMRVYGAQAWRFSTEDFRMASTYGVPDGSSLADWPISYDEVAPYYARVEKALGVAGDRTGNRFAGTDEPYPMPATPMNLSGRLLMDAATRLGWPTNRVPLAVNSVAYHGRPACPGCGACVGFGCRAEAKNGTHNTSLPLALSTRRCDLVTRCTASRLVTGPGGRVEAVELIDGHTGGRQTVSAGQFVVAAGAVESARLLLLSAHAGEPGGLANAHDQVGRHLQAHLYPGAVGLVDDIVQDGMGPGPTVAISSFRHGNEGIVGGGMLANDFVPLPMFTLGLMQAVGLIAPFGEDVHAALSHHYRRHLMIFGPIQVVTTADARVRLADGVRDRFGLPVAQLGGHVHDEDLRAADFMHDRAVEWLTAAGCREVRGLRSRPTGPSVGQHQAGTCRMGDDPSRSVVDPRGRLWGHDNVAVCDTSVHVTNGAVNPFLTGLALALRTSELMLHQ